ncbi:MAG TPA: ethanolamine ammonia-lyase subunit EutC [Acidisarcina sp.]
MKNTLNLRKYTPARVSLGLAGCALPTQDLLDLELAQAEARDAVHAALDVDRLLAGTEALGLHPVPLRSAAPDRAEYLRNPGLGRTLAAESISTLLGCCENWTGGCDLVLVLGDGLSASAANRHALPLIEVLLPLLRDEAWVLGPLCIVEQSRVGIGDAVGAVINPRFSVVLIGERPGLSSADSLGAYITWQPRPGRSDAERNCISNIRPEGLGYQEAAKRLSYLLHEGRRRGLTGVGLKDDLRIEGPAAQLLR